MKQFSSWIRNAQSDGTLWWIVVLLGSGVLLLLFIVASVDLIQIALQTQPDCVAHDRIGERSQSATMAAKSAC